MLVFSWPERSSWKEGGGSGAEAGHAQNYPLVQTETCGRKGVRGADVPRQWTPL